jgi:hypothetical protein
MASLMRCRAFGWDLFDAPLPMDARAFLATSSLLSTVLSDLPQLIVMWDAHGTTIKCVAMSFGLVSIIYAVASRWSTLLFLSATSARVRHMRPAQAWGRDEVDPLLLEWIVALDVCQGKVHGGAMSYDRYCKDGLRKLRASRQHDLALVMPVVIDEVGTKGGDGRVFADLNYDLHRQVPTATAGEGTRALQQLFGIEPDSASALRNTLHDTVLRVLAHDDTVDLSGELAAAASGHRDDDTWAVFERLAGFLVHRVDRLNAASR